jgi:hypothetical protein
MNNPARISKLIIKLESLFIRLEKYLFRLKKYLLRLNLENDNNNDKIINQKIETPIKSDANTVDMRKKDNIVIIHQQIRDISSKAR